MSNNGIRRILPVPKRSFFLFGARGTGKSTWLKQKFSNTMYFDLLKSSLYLELSQNPSKLEAMSGALPAGSWIVIDEIQKIPELLNEVHRLIENRKWNFALSGSSARKLKRKGVDLLAGRAVTRNFFPFSFAEIEDIFDLNVSLEWGMMPTVQMSRDESADLLSAYVDTYIKEEIREEGIIRKLSPFLRFLGVAGILNGQVINSLNISREAAVPRSNVDSYFSILQDTLLGTFLPAYRPNLKVREQSHPKFYWFDSGVARAAAGFLFQPVDRLWLGTSLETFIYNELRIYNQLSGRNFPIYYYRTAAGSEIDFVIETRKRQLDAKPHVVCIEVKMAEKWKSEWEKSIRSLDGENNIVADKMIGVYTGSQRYIFGKFQVMPVTDFLKDLYSGNIY
jgi:predicted AAA+ superfamily ATPase